MIVIEAYNTNLFSQNSGRLIFEWQKFAGPCFGGSYWMETTLPLMA